MTIRPSEMPEETQARWDTYHTYSRLRFGAGTTSDFLEASWRRPKRHNRAIEREALSRALRLDAACRTALADGTATPSAAIASTATRYEVLAAVRTVHVILPFTLCERDRLSLPVMIGGSTFEDESDVPDLVLLERWHEWLWMDELGEPQTSVEALGASAIFGEACRRLSQSLPEVITRIGL